MLSSRLVALGCHSNVLWISLLFAAIVPLGNCPVSGAPAQLESTETPFTLDLQPPVFDASASADDKALDSYGRPIETLKPIDTPDGRKVVSAQGLQFEIPSYASGITEITQPADDLLPPFIAPFELTGATSATEPTETPLAVDRETFPPFGGIGADIAAPTKTTFTKSEDGKVITNSIFLTSAPENALATQKKDFQTVQANQIKVPTISGFPQLGITATGTSVIPKPFLASSEASAATTAAANLGGIKYTGSFGGPPGVLIPQNGGSTTFVSINKNLNRQGQVFSTTTATSNIQKYTGSFGGPPGVLVPFDNVKESKPQ